MVYNNKVLQSLSGVDKKLFVKVMDIFLVTQNYVQNNLQGTKESLIFECHSTCRAIAEHVVELKVSDGHYIGITKNQSKEKVKVQLKFCSHSWLVTPSGSIIDPYPVGFLSVNPVLIVTRGKYKSFGGNFYWEDEKVTEVIDTKELREKVEVLSRIISKAQKPHLIS